MINNSIALFEHRLSGLICQYALQYGLRSRVERLIMRFFSSRIGSRCFGTSLLCASLLCAGIGTSGVAARADENGDWKAWSAVRKEIEGKTLLTDPEAAIAQLKTFGATENLSPNVRAEVVNTVANIYQNKLKQPQLAAQVIEEALRQTPPSPDAPQSVVFLQNKAGLLLADKKSEAAQALLQSNSATIEAAGKSGHPYLSSQASRALMRLVEAQDALRPAGAKAEDTVGVLEYALLQMPVYLEPKNQVALDWSAGWMYERLVKSLVEQGRMEEALSWGRLYFAEAEFDGKAIERASGPVSSVWAKSGELVKLRSFAIAQTDEAGDVVNPLAGVPLPDLGGDKGAAATELAKLQKLQKFKASRGRVPTMIGLHIALGQWRAAMDAATALVVEDVGAADGPQQVARVLKAHDSSVVRANQFLAYLEGKAPNPVPAFLAEVEAETGNTNTEVPR